MFSELNNIDVLILCGGLGKRLKKICRNRPKPLVKIGSRPFLDAMIGYLKSFGFSRFILGTGYKSDMIKKHYLKANIPGARIVISKESTPLGTAGAVKNAQRLIKSKYFFVLNGDTICEFDPKKLLEFHKKKNALISILLKKKSRKGEFGRIKVKLDSRITEFVEKDQSPNLSLINAGVYIFSREVLKSIPDNVKFSLEYDLFPSLINKRIFGYKNSKLFIDIGTPSGYFEARSVLLGKKVWKK